MKTELLSNVRKDNMTNLIMNQQSGGFLYPDYLHWVCMYWPVYFVLCMYVSCDLTISVWLDLSLGFDQGSGTCMSIQELKEKTFHFHS